MQMALPNPGKKCVLKKKKNDKPFDQMTMAFLKMR